MSDIDKLIVSPDDFEQENPPRSAEGGYGIVTFGTQKITNKKYALKRTRHVLLSPEYKRAFDRELNILATCKHPTITPFLGWCTKDYIGYIYLLEMEKGSLDHCISENRKSGTPYLDDTRKYIISFGIAVGMEYLHSKNVIHRDLKPANILLDSQYRPFLTDFGTSKVIDSNMPINQTCQYTSPIIMAPEFFEDPATFSNTKEIDVYSFAILLYHLWTEMAPFADFGRNLPKLITTVTSGGRPPIPNVLPEHWKRLIQQCWDQVPSKRPTFSQILAKFETDEFLNGLDENSINEYKRYLTNGESEIGVRRGLLQSSLKQFRESPMLTRLRQAADPAIGDRESQYQYAYAQYEGTYGTQNLEEAASYFLKIADAKDADQNVPMVSASLFYAGKSLAALEQYEKANNIYRRAIFKGNKEACFEVAELIFDGKIQPRNPNECFTFYKLAADAQIPKAVNKFARLAYAGTFTGRPDHKTAMHYFELGSNLGDPEMIYMWAKRLEHGISVTQNIPEAMRLLQLSADLKYWQAQIDYAYHLYHGLHVEQQIGEASLYLEKAAHQDCSPEASYLFSRLILKENPALSKTYLDRSYAFGYPEAYAAIGKQQAEQNDLTNAITSLSFAMSNGSFNAMIAFAHIAEQTGQYGDAYQYYQNAANHCHALDNQAFYYPDVYKVFHCDDCNIDVCEGCAYFCHIKLHHAVSEIGVTTCMKCQCGEKGFPDHCNVEFIGEDNSLQHLYLCQSCCLTSDKLLVCKSCAEKCHAGHALIDMGIQKNHCSCGLYQLPFHFKCKILPQLQSSLDPTLKCSNVKQKQRWFQCMQCALYGSDETGICGCCAKCCHEGHLLIDKGIQERACCCVDNCDLKQKPDNA